MRKIKAQNMSDFRDLNVRKLDGDLRASRQLIENSIQKIQELKETRPDITLQEIQQEGIFSYEFQMIPDFSKYFERGIMG